MTHVLYADDLMVMGQATGNEVTKLKQIFDKFALHSGLIINPDKSTIWFSRGCEEETRNEVISEFGARLADEKEQYLGIIVTQSGKENEHTQGLMLDKMRKKLAGWKKGLLSAAGRLALIKSVLLSVPVYYMSVGVLSHNTIKELNKVIRLFFWGHVGDKKQMSLIAWEKICQPYEKGGLGIRNLKLFNQSLVLKAVWQVASNCDRLWVQVVRAKYFSRRGFWGVNGTREEAGYGAQSKTSKPFSRNRLYGMSGMAKRYHASTNHGSQAGAYRQ